MTVHVAAFAPHPDDAELCCGGLLLKLASLGYQTAVIDLTKGELSSRGNLESRAVETKNATEILGLAKRVNLGLCDGAIRDDDESRRKIVSVLRELQPEIVIAPYWVARHPDHECASTLVTHSIFLAGVKKYHPQARGTWTPKQVLYYPMRIEFRPSFITDISLVHTQKIAAIRCYESQLHNEKPEGHLTLLASPLTLDAFTARDRHYGAMIGVEFGEAYLSRATLSIGDPVSHFRNQPAALFMPE